MYTQNPFITLSSNCRPVRVIKFVSEESIEEGIYTIALEKLRLEQDLTNEEEENNDGEGTYVFFLGFWKSGILGFRNSTVPDFWITNFIMIFQIC